MQTLTAGTTSTLPHFNQLITIFPFTVATFCAPSDLCETGGMHAEHIRAISTWLGGPGHYDCVLIQCNCGPLDLDTHGLQNYHVACIHLIFSFVFFRIQYSCALIHKFLPVDKEPDEKTGMWIMQHQPHAQVITLDPILHSAHLIPVYGYEEAALPKTCTPEGSLDNFEWFYINKFVDHHAFKVAF